MYFAPMLSIKSLNLVQFRNYVQQRFDFNHRIVGIVGSNGTGKTNILDALYYLSFTKSYFNRPDAQNVHHAFQGMRIDGHYTLNNNDIAITCILRENLKKEFYFDELVYSKLSQHIGKIPCVMIAPDDVQIITGTSEERRKLMDSLLSQLYPDYLQYLINYNKVLVQRNSYLKQSAENGSFDSIIIEAFNDQLLKFGTIIFNYRKELLDQLLPEILSLYKYLAGKLEDIHIEYQSTLRNGDYAIQLKESFQKDFVLSRTTVGIHKDDLLITIQGQSFKQEASQGQRKSLLFAIRLAEWIFIKKITNLSPILLLDDIFEKLDENRMIQLLDWVNQHTDSQVFITDTHKERVEALLSRHVVNFQVIQL
jgi:DNA replication and repair protein RecF